MAVAVGLRLWWCLLFGFAIICSARHTISLSGTGDEVAVVLEAMEGRSLVSVNLNDYSEASANHGHDPRTRVGGGRKSHDSP